MKLGAFKRALPFAQGGRKPILTSLDIALHEKLRLCVPAAFQHAYDYLATQNTAQLGFDVEQLVLVALGQIGEQREDVPLVVFD
jgi:hypothetical protein